MARPWRLAAAHQVLPMEEDVEGWLRFSALCRKDNRRQMGHRMLLRLLGYDPAERSQPGQPGYGAGSGAPAVMLAYLKYLWAQGERSQAFRRCALRRVMLCLPSPICLEQHLWNSIRAQICVLWGRGMLLWGGRHWGFGQEVKAAGWQLAAALPVGPVAGALAGPD